MRVIACALGLLLASAPEGHISTSSGMATITATTVYGGAINLERDDHGTWRGSHGRGRVEFSEKRCRVIREGRTDSRSR